MVYVPAAFSSCNLLWQSSCLIWVVAKEIYSPLYADIVAYYMEIWLWNTIFTKHNIPKLLGLYGHLCNTKLTHKTLVTRCSFDSPQSKVSTCYALSLFHLCCTLNGQYHPLDASSLATAWIIQHNSWTAAFLTAFPWKKRFVSSISVECSRRLLSASGLPEGRYWLGGNTTK